MSSDLGDRIKRLREARRLRGLHWRQEDVSRDLGVSMRTLGRWENEGVVPRSAIGALEEYFGVPLTGEQDGMRPRDGYEAELLALKDHLPAGEAERLVEMYRDQTGRRRNSA